MSIIPVWVKALAILAITVALGLAWNAFLHHEQSIGYQRRVAEDNVALIAAQTAAATETERLTKEKDNAVNARITAEKKVSVANAAVASANLQLRDTRARLRNGLPNATIASCRTINAAYDIVFGQCTEQLETVARYADGCTADTLMYQQAWPK